MESCTANTGPSNSTFAALEHAALLHPTGTDGRVSVARVDEHGRWREKSHNVKKLPDLIAEIAGETDTYLSMSRFFGRREIAHLWQLGAMYVDVDYHKVPEYRDAHPLGVLDDVLAALERAQIPAPTLALFSGRGLYVIWLHNAVPRAAAPRWNAAQRELWKALEPFGADRNALDAARVLRVAGTVNSKSGAFVERVAPVGEVYDFDALAEEVLPLTREELAEIRDIRAARARRKPPESPVTPPRGFTVGTLWEGRLTDLQALVDMRFLDGRLPPGQRDNWMLIAGVAMSWICVPQALQRELTSLARQVGGWSEREAASRLQAVTKRGHMAARGEKIEWPIGSGRMVDPRYRFKNQTIMELLEITADEEESMKVLISSDEARRRDRKRKEKERREAGMVSRAEYEGAALARERGPVIVRLRDEGMSLRQISRETDIPYEEVRRLSKRLENLVGKG